VARQLRWRKPERIVAGLAFQAESGRGMIDRPQPGLRIVGLMAPDATDGRAVERAIPQVAMALLAGNERVLADEGEVAASVRVHVEERPPALGVVAPLAVRSEFAGMAIAVAAGTGVRHGDGEVLRVAAAARHGDVPAPQREPGRVVVEANILPSVDGVASRAPGSVAQRTRRCRRGAQPNFGRFRLRILLRELGLNGAPRAVGRWRGLWPSWRHDQGNSQDHPGPHGSNPRNSPW